MLAAAEQQDDLIHVHSYRLATVQLCVPDPHCDDHVVALLALNSNYIPACGQNQKGGQQILMLAYSNCLPHLRMCRTGSLRLLAETPARVMYKLLGSSLMPFILMVMSQNSVQSPARSRLYRCRFCPVCHPAMISVVALQDWWKIILMLHITMSMTEVLTYIYHCWDLLT